MEKTSPSMDQMSPQLSQMGQLAMEKKTPSMDQVEKCTDQSDGSGMLPSDICYSTFHHETGPKNTQLPGRVLAFSKSKRWWPPHSYPCRKLKMEKFIQMVKALQGCPWVPVREELSLIQSQLGKCCNASHSFIVTQQNSPIGSTISFDGEKQTLKVTKHFYNLFPKKSPFLKPLRSCAVVGNGGILNGSFCRAEIDKADFVFRMNLPPLNWTDDVGTKTDLVTINPSILIKKTTTEIYNELRKQDQDCGYFAFDYCFFILKKRRKPFIEKIKEYGPALVLLPAFSYSLNTIVSVRVLYTLEDFDLKNKVVFFNPDYLTHWQSKGLEFQRMSSGLMLVSAAMEVCENVTLYGFWPFTEDLNGVPILHHYYDDLPPKSQTHNMPDEFYQYLQMHVQGSLRLNLASC
ncbi:alpha-2,8-sialyltransferase 8F-like [Gastrophryne carolinensis]